MKRVAHYTFWVLLTLALLFLLWQLRIAVVIFLLALAVAAMIHPLAEPAMNLGLPHRWAVLLTYLVLALLVGGLLFLVGRLLMQDLQEFANNFTIWYDQARGHWPTSSNPLLRILGQQMLPSQNLYDLFSNGWAGLVARTGMELTRSIAQILGTVGVAVVLSLYWNISHRRFKRLWLSLLPPTERAETRAIWAAMEQEVGRYLRGAVLQSFLAGVLLWLLYVLFGAKYAALMALGGALAQWVPGLAPLLATGVALLVEMLGGEGVSVAVAASTLLLSLALDLAVRPRFFSRRGYSSLLIVLIMIAMAQVAGLPGVLLSAPLAAVLHVLLNRSLHLSKLSADGEARLTVEHLHERLRQLRAQVPDEAPPSPELQSYIERLEALLQEAHQVYEAHYAKATPTIYDQN